MVQKLLELGADDSIPNAKGHRAFDIAVKNRHLPVVQFLLSDGKFCSGVVPFKWDLKGLERDAADEEQKHFVSEVRKLVRLRDRSLKTLLEQETTQEFTKRREEAFEIWCKSWHQEDLLLHMSSDDHWGRALIVDVNEEEAHDIRRLHARIAVDIVRMTHESSTVIVRSTAGLVAGMHVFGDGIPSHTTVLDIISESQLELSNSCHISSDSHQIFFLTDYNILEPSVFDTDPPPLHADLFKAVAYSLSSVSSRIDIEKCLKAYGQNLPTKDMSALYLLAHARLCHGDNCENRALFVELLSRFEQICQKNGVDAETWVTVEEYAEICKWKQCSSSHSSHLESDSTPSATQPADDEYDADVSVDFEKFMESQDFKALTPDQRLPMIQLQMLSGLTEIKKIACQLYEEMSFQKSSAEQKAESRSRALNYAFVGSPVRPFPTPHSPFFLSDLNFRSLCDCFTGNWKDNCRPYFLPNSRSIRCPHRRTIHEHVSTRGHSTWTRWFYHSAQKIVR